MTRRWILACWWCTGALLVGAVGTMLPAPWRWVGLALLVAGIGVQAVTSRGVSRTMVQSQQMMTEYKQSLHKEHADVDEIQARNSALQAECDNALAGVEDAERNLARAQTLSTFLTEFSGMLIAQIEGRSAQVSEACAQVPQIKHGLARVQAAWARREQYEQSQRDRARSEFDAVQAERDRQWSTRLHEVVESIIRHIDREPASIQVESEHDSQIRTWLNEVEQVLRQREERLTADLERRGGGLVTSAAANVQNAAHDMQAEMVRLLREDFPPEVHRIALEADHVAAEAARRAAGIEVLAGGRSQQTWPRHLSLTEAVLGASARIRYWQSVTPKGKDLPLAVDRHIAEYLMMVLAELLSNATEASPEVYEVVVEFSKVEHGAAIVIKDGGTGIDDPRELQKYDDRASGRTPCPLSTALGNEPRIGLAVVGTLAAEFGFGVALRKSSYLGIEATVVVPSRWLHRTGEIGSEEPPRVTSRTPQAPRVPAQASAPAEQPRHSAPEHVTTNHHEAEQADPGARPELPRRRAQASGASQIVATPARVAPRDTPAEAAHTMEQLFGATGAEQESQPPDQQTTTSPEES